MAGRNHRVTFLEKGDCKSVSKLRMGDADLDFSLSPVKRATAKQGRRAGGKDEQLDRPMHIFSLYSKDIAPFWAAAQKERAPDG